MNQSSFIAAFLLAGFVLYLAANNRLSAYTAVLWGSPSSQATGGSGSNVQPSVATGTPLNPMAMGADVNTPANQAAGGASSSVGPQQLEQLGSTISGWFSGLSGLGALFGL